MSCSSNEALWWIHVFIFIYHIVGICWGHWGDGGNTNQLVLHMSQPSSIWKVFHFWPPAEWKLLSIFALSSDLHSERDCRMGRVEERNLSIYAYLCLYVGHVQTRSHQASARRPSLIIIIVFCSGSLSIDRRTSILVGSKEIENRQPHHRQGGRWRAENLNIKKTLPEYSQEIFEIHSSHKIHFMS